ncbi:Cof-type HAD-IIB family hydrolase [Tetragenococcus muriaticus]|uniref:HAD superfamily hydrolase n=2 Tax=Tetragenococcus muriaticus TaxID=64642 RepID=A0A091CDD2_9ENTE|nr:Cof-type HAD-IIB family hydrolase [Tetragenococcus muriaticus]KFN91878.1 HAD superfamily hydrolase [Tetragenococcus muriaticus 3MR10-3]KFN92514.1 HAD superfamily hydrolase [Tetragenococcus muriaticus PMC-11-5]GMA47519.1 haloacid dehalogenase [Tetragenococcus muriaticus]
MPKKLIALDLDGTTLNNASLISSRTAQILQKARDKGHIISIATGRPYRMSAHYYQQLHLDTPMVNFNGSLIHKPKEKWTYEKEFSVPREIAFEILEKKEQLHLDFVAAENRQTFFIDKLENFQKEFFATDIATEANLFPQLKTNPTSIMLKTKNEFASFVTEALAQQFSNEIDVKTWGGKDTILEVVPKGVQKAMAVSLVAEAMQIKQKDIVAFGDEHNDVELLEYAGWGVAMKNGTDQLKSVANDVTTKTNDEEGMVDYLEELLAI